MSFDSLFVPDIRRSCSALVEYSYILGCDATSTVNIYQGLGGVAVTILSVSPRRMSDWLVVFKTEEERASSAESDSRNNLLRLLEPEEGETKRR